MVKKLKKVAPASTGQVAPEISEPSLKKKLKKHKAVATSPSLAPLSSPKQSPRGVTQVQKSPKAAVTDPSSKKRKLDSVDVKAEIAADARPAERPSDSSKSDKKSTVAGGKQKEAWDDKQKRKEANRKLREQYAADPSSLTGAELERAKVLQKVILATESARAKQQERAQAVDAAGGEPEATESSNSLKRKKLRKDGDWDCKSCGAVVFASKMVCFKCNTERSDAPGESDNGKAKGKGKTRLAGDWDCPSCAAVVFASRASCYKCSTVKPTSGDAPSAPMDVRGSKGSGGRGRGGGAGGVFTGRGRGYHA